MASELLGANSESPLIAVPTLQNPINSVMQ